MSSATSVRDALEGYVAGRLTAEQLVSAVAAAYYGEQGAGSREQLKPVIEIIERAHPGVVELTGSADRPGFAVRLAQRPFPKRYEAEFRQAVQASLVQGIGVPDVGAQHAAPLHDPAIASAPRPGVWSRIVRAVRRLFTAST